MVSIGRVPSVCCNHYYCEKCFQACDQPKQYANVPLALHMLVVSLKRAARKTLPHNYQNSASVVRLVAGAQLKWQWSVSEFDHKTGAAADDAAAAAIWATGMRCMRSAKNADIASQAQLAVPVPLTARLTGVTLLKLHCCLIHASQYSISGISGHGWLRLAGTANATRGHQISMAK